MNRTITLDGRMFSLIADQLKSFEEAVLHEGSDDDIQDACDDYGFDTITELTEAVTESIKLFRE